MEALLASVLAATPPLVAPSLGLRARLARGNGLSMTLIPLPMSLGGASGWPKGVRP